MRIEIKPDVKKTTFSATYQGTGEDHGKKYKWKFYRHPKHGWMLEDYEGYEKLLEALEDAEFLLRKAGLMAGPMRDSFNRSASDARAAIAKATGKGDA